MKIVSTCLTSGYLSTMCAIALKRCSHDWKKNGSWMGKLGNGSFYSCPVLYTSSRGIHSCPSLEAG